MLKKSIKYTIMGFIALIGIGIVYFQHQISFDPSNITVFNKSYNLSKHFPQNYRNYVSKSQKQPNYVRDSDIFQAYQDYCHQNQKNCIILPHQQTYSDLIWIGSIQYIGSILDVTDAPYLYDLLNNLTNLSPYWDYPYFFGSLMLPVSKSTQSIDQKTKNKFRNQSVQIGEKGKKYNCDQNKLKQIKELPLKKFNKIVFQKDLKKNSLYNPCDTHKIPNQLGFNYFQYLEDWQKSIQNYKIASFQPNRPQITPSMVSIVSGKGGNHIKSIKVLFSKIRSIQKDLSESKDKSQIDMYQKRIKENLIKMLHQYQFLLIKKANKKADKNDKNQYNKLVQKGYLKSIIQNQINKCQQTKRINLKDINFKKDQNTQQILCYLLNYGIKQKSINPQTGRLNSAYNIRKDSSGFKFKRNPSTKRRTDKMFR